MHCFWLCFFGVDVKLEHLFIQNFLNVDHSFILMLLLLLKTRKTFLDIAQAVINDIHFVLKLRVFVILNDLTLERLKQNSKLLQEHVIGVFNFSIWKDDDALLRVIKDVFENTLLLDNLTPEFLNHNHPIVLNGHKDDQPDKHGG